MTVARGAPPDKGFVDDQGTQRASATRRTVTKRFHPAAASPFQEPHQNDGGRVRW